MSTTSKKKGAPPDVAQPAEPVEVIEESIAALRDEQPAEEAAETVEEEAGAEASHQDSPAQPEAAEQAFEELERMYAEESPALKKEAAPAQEPPPVLRVVSPTPEERGPVADAWAVAKALALRPSALAVRLEGIGCSRDARGIFEVDEVALMRLGFDRGTARTALTKAKACALPPDAHGARVAAISPDPRLVGVRVEEGCATVYALTREPIRQTGIEVVVVPTPAGWEVFHG